MMALQPNRPRGLFGSARRFPMRSDGSPIIGDAALAAGQAGPPPLTDAPAAPANWQSLLGPELLASLPQGDPSGAPALDSQRLAPAPPMRGGPLEPKGLFGGSGIPLGAPGAPPSAAALNAGAGSAMQRGGANLADTAAGAMPKKKGFDFRLAAGALADALGALNGQAPMFAIARMKERQANADQQRQLAEITLRSRLKAAEPDYFTAGNDRVRYDPTTRTAETLYTAPEEFDTYARSLGAEPGTPEYDRLAQDYVLRSAGPTATDYNLTEEENRQENRIGLEGVRQGNRSALLDQRFGNSRALKGTPTYRQANPLPRKPAANRGGAGGVREGQTATGPGGAKLVYRGGKWTPLR